MAESFQQIGVVAVPLLYLVAGLSAAGNAFAR
jgi:hypothetical protein